MTIVEVSALLNRHGIPHAVIGAVALSVHGVVRASADTDVLVTDRRCLDVTIWEGFAASGARVDARRGDADDPLAGVVRLTPPDGTRVDIMALSLVAMAIGDRRVTMSGDRGSRALDDLLHGQGDAQGGSKLAHLGRR